MRGDMRGDMRGRDGSAALVMAALVMAALVMAALVMAALVMAAKIYRKILFLNRCATFSNLLIVAKYC